jgi:hypothetical protein
MDSVLTFNVPNPLNGNLFLPITQFIRVMQKERTPKTAKKLYIHREFNK